MEAEHTKEAYTHNATRKGQIKLCVASTQMAKLLSKGTLSIVLYLSMCRGWLQTLRTSLVGARLSFKDFDSRVHSADPFSTSSMFPNGLSRITGRGQ